MRGRLRGRPCLDQLVLSGRLTRRCGLDRSVRQHRFGTGDRSVRVFFNLIPGHRRGSGRRFGNRNTTGLCEQFDRRRGGVHHRREDLHLPRLQQSDGLRHLRFGARRFSKDRFVALRRRDFRPDLFNLVPRHRGGACRRLSDRMTAGSRQKQFNRGNYRLCRRRRRLDLSERWRDKIGRDGVRRF